MVILRKVLNGAASGEKSKDSEVGGRRLRSVAL